MNWSGSLKVRTLIVLTALLVTGVVSVTGYVYSNAKEQIMDNLKHGAQQALSIHAERLSTWVKTRMAEVEVVANTDIVRSMDYEKAMPYLIREMKRFGGTYNSFGLCDTRGNLTLHNGVVINISSESSFPDIMATGKSVVSNPFPDKQNNRDMIISMETGIKNNNGQVVGLVSGACLVNTVFEQNTDFHIGKTDKVFIIDKEGLVLYHPDGGALESNIFKDRFGDYQKAVRDLLNDTVPFSTISVENQAKILFASPVSGTSWYMVLEVPLTEYTSGLNTLLVKVTAITTIAVLLMMIITMLLLKGLFQRIHVLERATANTAKGDLRIQLAEQEDELGKVNASFNQMVNGLRSLVEEMSHASKSVSETSTSYRRLTEQVVQTGNSVTTTMSELSEGTQTTAREIEQITMAIEGMNQTVSRLVEIGQMVEQVVEDARIRVKDGAASVVHTMNRMDDIGINVQKSSSVVNELGQKSESIATVISAISSIASQTNLLALNAAIEAARAGDAGRGFAVVADEVRKLAEQSANAAAEISEQIQSIQAQISLAVSTMQQSGKSMIEGTTAMHSIKGIFDGIALGVENISKASHDVVVVANEIAGGKKRIVDAVVNTSALSQQVAAASEHAVTLIANQKGSLNELQWAASQMEELSGELNEKIHQFQL
ncbi:HAMP domain-containing protein [Heliobacillus mobilis]|uniref:HAMP domain-containing protein n=1 Tax=Heliobacterium mobile TaxID=28064 RepID=A0A6I3SNC6_HELMO|nr:methyl-accepting chemotaxis protein [Heliobacterium mobile]MTV50215.1 HAMP domain-containing protein [Heliobacterium mobile]